MVSGPADIGEYLVADGIRVNGIVGIHAESYIRSGILWAYSDIKAEVHLHVEDAFPYTVLNSIGPKSLYQRVAFLRSRMLD